MSGFIDPPDVFAPLSEWRAYLRQLESYPDKTQRADAIREAREMIEYLEDRAA